MTNSAMYGYGFMQKGEDAMTYEELEERTRPRCQGNKIDSRSIIERLQENEKLLAETKAVLQSAQKRILDLEVMIRGDQPEERA